MKGMISEMEWRTKLCISSKNNYLVILLYNNDDDNDNNTLLGYYVLRTVLNIVHTLSDLTWRGRDDNPYSTD